MQQKEIDEILSYLNKKFDENIPNFVKILISKKIHKLQSFNPESLPDSLKHCTVEELIVLLQQQLESKRLKL